MQAPVAGDLLDDVIKGTIVDPLLQPLARLADQGKTVQALVGPPFFVTAIMLHQQQRASMDPPQEPSPLVMAVAVEGLRSSLMAWMDVAGPKFDAAMEREALFEAKYGQRVDDMIALIFMAPAASAEESAGHPVSCDWGDCDGTAVGYRQWTPLGGWHAPIWLPVCDDHEPAQLILVV
jgi:hypothetical protein